MIHVDRSRVPKPEIFTSALADDLRRSAAEWFDPKNLDKHRQERFPFESKIWLGVETTLNQLFHSKCAYCEQVLRDPPLVVGHFRPFGDCIRLRGEVFPNGYWWLAYEWDNLYSVCRECDSIKGNRFPVLGGHTRIAGPKELHAVEKALLLDPCFDRPELHLQFQEDGTVCSITPDDDLLDPDWKSGAESKAVRQEVEDQRSYKRGGVTIELLGLNRAGLVAMRQKQWRQIEEVWQACLHSPAGSPDLAGRLRLLFRYLDLEEARTDEYQLRNKSSNISAPWRGSPFAGMARQMIAARIAAAQSAGTLPSELLPLASALPPLLPIAPAEGTQVKPLGVVSAESIEVKAAPKLDMGTSTAYITRIEIENFKCIRHFELNIPGTFDKEVEQPSPTPDSTDPSQRQPRRVLQTFAPWMILLGENGTGKSSVLQAVAMALMGKEFIAREGFRPEKILRRTQSGQAREGFVKVHLSDQLIELRFNRQGFHFADGSTGVQIYLRGYGATRLLPRKSSPPEKIIASCDVDNLFDPFHPLFDVEPWLLRPRNPRFDGVALAYKDILGLEGKGIFVRGRKRVRMIDPQGILVGLDELSDGYQSVLALATDIIAGVPEELSDFRNAYGIVLIDEIGANLHPRLRMLFIDSLRRTFPRMQFLVTTHEPLCLRGLRKGEITVWLRVKQDRVVRRRVGGRVEEKQQPETKLLIVNAEDLPDPGTLRVDQLLTSRFFGLGSTIDPDLDKKLQAYYALLNRQKNAQGAGLTSAELALRDQLKRELEPFNLALGVTRRDQMVYDLIDEFLASEPAALVKDSWVELNKQTKEKVFEIWRRVQLRQGEPR